MTRRTFHIVIILAVLSGVLPFSHRPTTTTSAQISTSNRNMLFSSEADGDWDIYVIDVSTDRQQQLTRNNSQDIQPAWSPDGTKIAFTSDRDGNYDLYVMNADGSNVQRLTSFSGGDMEAVWSPDGEQIAFTVLEKENWDVYVMDADGRNRKRLTRSPSVESSPTWSPYGGQLAFASDRDGDFDIYIMDLAGNIIRQVTDNPAADRSPSWCPDGKHIVFTSDRGGTDDIYMVDVFGADTQALIVHPATEGQPECSPYDQQISFVSDRDGDFEIYVADIEGGNVRQLTNNPGMSLYARWPTLPVEFVSRTEPINVSLGDEVPTVNGIAAALTDDEQIGIVAVHENGEMLGVMVERDPIGEIQAVDGVVWRSPQGDWMVMYLDQDGLPERAIANDTVLLYSNYTTDTVDVVAVAPDGSIKGATTMPYDRAALQDARAMTPSQSGIVLASARVESKEMLQFLKLASLTVSVFTCAVGVMCVPTAAVATAPAAGAGAIACAPILGVCKGAIIATASILVAEQSAALAATSAGLNGYDCINAATLAHPTTADPSAVPAAASCVNWVIDSGVALMEVAQKAESDVQPTVSDAQQRLSAGTLPADPAQFAQSTAPCTVRASNEVSVRVGPGENRGVYTSLPANRDFTVTGQSTANDGSLWWQLDKTEIEGGDMANSLWVAQTDVVSSGNCSVAAVEAVAPPPVILPRPSPVPTSAAPPVTAGEPYVYFRADSTNISPGECTTLRWDVENIASVYLLIDGRTEGVIGHSTRTVCPNVTTTYTLRVNKRDGGTLTRTVTIYVGPGGSTPTRNPTVTPIAVPSIDYWVSNQNPQFGEYVTFYWNIQNAVSATFQIGSGARNPVALVDSRTVQIVSSLCDSTFRIHALGYDGYTYSRSMTLTCQSG